MLTALERRTALAEADAFKAEWISRLAALGDILVPIEDQRAAFDAEHGAVALPTGCAVEPLNWPGIAGERLRPVGADENHVLLYHHGGGHAFGSALSHRHLVARIAHGAGVVAYNMDQRLAPEHPFPQALDDALAAYRQLLELGYAPQNIVVAGESAGGGLSAALLLRLKQLGLPQPAGAWLLSPWLDLTQSGEAYSSRAAHDPMVSREILQGLADLYFPNPTDANTPLVSPLCGDLAGLPPVLIQVGTDEILLGDSTRFAHRAALAGVSIDLSVWAGMVHAWPLFHHRMATAGDKAIEQAATWIRCTLID